MAESQKRSQRAPGPQNSSTAVAAPPAYRIEVRFQGGLTRSQQDVFQTAADRWSRVITADVPDVVFQGEAIEDLVIDAFGVRIDGPLGVLGQAGPTVVRTGSLIPAKGMMEFDIADLARMELDGSLESVIIHEMGHVIGLGTLWAGLGLVRGAGSGNPRYFGRNASAAYTALVNAPRLVPVPLENRGGPGTADSHWREDVFGNELMTGFINAGVNPLSAVTVGALRDIGYEVDEAAADAFVLPGFQSISALGTGEQCRACGLRRGVEMVVLPADAEK